MELHTTSNVCESKEFWSTEVARYCPLKKANARLKNPPTFRRAAPLDFQTLLCFFLRESKTRSVFFLFSTMRPPTSKSTVISWFRGEVPERRLKLLNGVPAVYLTHAFLALLAIAAVRGMNNLRGCSSSDSSNPTRASNFFVCPLGTGKPAKNRLQVNSVHRRSRYCMG